MSIKNGLIKNCCKCGKEIYVQPSRWEAGRGRYCSRSCGNSMTSKKHGHSTGNKFSSTYSTWATMKSRCINTASPKYYMYGEKGITVCEEWLDFSRFLRDMGERPKGMTLDRIDGTKGYFKENCRWATPAQQQRNLKSNVMINYKEQEYILTDLANLLGLSPATLKYRIRAGWNENDYSTPAKLGNRRKLT